MNSLERKIQGAQHQAYKQWRRDEKNTSTGFVEYCEKIGGFKFCRRQVQKNGSGVNSLVQLEEGYIILDEKLVFLFLLKWS